MKNSIKNIFLTVSMLLSVLSIFANSINPDSSRLTYPNDAKISSYSRCFYVNFSYIKDGETYYGFFGSKCVSGTPNIEGMKIYVAMRVGCIPKNVTIMNGNIVSICNAEYQMMFAPDRLGKVIVYSKRDYTL